MYQMNHIRNVLIGPFWAAKTKHQILLLSRRILGPIQLTRNLQWTDAIQRALTATSRVLLQIAPRQIRMLRSSLGKYSNQPMVFRVPIRRTLPCRNDGWTRCTIVPRYLPGTHDRIRRQVTRLKAGSTFPGHSTHQNSKGPISILCPSRNIHTKNIPYRGHSRNFRNLNQLLFAFPHRKVSACYQTWVGTTLRIRSRATRIVI